MIGYNGCSSNILVDDEKYRKIYEISYTNKYINWHRSDIGKLQTLSLRQLQKFLRAHWLIFFP